MASYSVFRDIGAYTALVGGAVLTLASRLKNENIKDLKERVSLLENERADARQQHMANQKAISLLEGKLESYKEIPLQSIADSLEKLTTVLAPDQMPSGKMVTHITKEEHFEEKGK